MNDAATPVDSRLLMLGELAEIGLAAARAIGRQAEDGTTPAADIALAYARVSRAVRLTIKMQTELAQDAAGDAPRSPQYARKVRVERIVERLAMAEHPDDEDAASDLIVEAGERLDDEDLYGDLMDRPLSELVARICDDLGLKPDWVRLAQEHWATAEAASDTVGWPLYLPLSRQRSAGGGPIAERSAERLVEGANSSPPPPAPSTIGFSADGPSPANASALGEVVGLYPP